MFVHHHAKIGFLQELGCTQVIVVTVVTTDILFIFYKYTHFFLYFLYEHILNKYLLSRKKFLNNFLKRKLYKKYKITCLNNFNFINYLLILSSKSKNISMYNCMIINIIGKWGFNNH